MKGITIHTDNRETAEEIRETLSRNYADHINCYYFDGKWFVELEGDDIEMNTAEQALNANFGADEMTYEIDNF